MRALPTEFLPPDPYADQPSPRRGNRATIALAFAVGGLGVLFFTAGALFFLTLPASIAGWVLGNRVKRESRGDDQAKLAVIIGIVGAVFGVVAAIVWVLVVGLGESTES